MKLKPFSYSVKVWLTSVILAPLMFIVIDTFTVDSYFEDTTSFINRQLGRYVLCVVFGMILSLITWLIFFAIIWLITTYSPPEAGVKYWIAVLGAMLTVGTFAIFVPSPDFTDELFYLMVSNCICIAGGSLFYKLIITDERQAC